MARAQIFNGILARWNEPEPEVFEFGNEDDIQDAIGPLSLDKVPYPMQLGRHGLFAYLDDAAILRPGPPLPYNRWGICGDMLIARRDSWKGTFLPLSDDEIRVVTAELLESNGYLDPDVPDWEDHGILSMYPNGEPPRFWALVKALRDAGMIGGYDLIETNEARCFIEAWLPLGIGNVRRRLRLEETTEGLQPNWNPSPSLCTGIRAAGFRLLM